MATTILGGDLKLIADNAVSAASDLLVSLKSFAVQAETRENVQEGDTVQVFAASQVADAAEYNAASNNYATDNGGTQAYKAVTINKHKKSTFSIKASKLNRLGTSDFQAIVNAHTQAVLSGMVKDLFAQITVANFPTIATGAPVTTAAAFDTGEVNAIETQLATLLGIKSPHYLVLNPAYFESLRNDSKIVSVANLGGSEVIRGGKIPGLFGFAETLRSNAFPAAGNLVGFGTDASGLLVANVVEDKSNIKDKDFEIAVDPDTNISIAVSGYFNDDTEVYNGTVETWYGFGVGRSTGIVRLIKAADPS